MMIKKFGVSFILIGYLFSMLIYFWRMSHDTPELTYWNSYGWTVFYDSSLMIPLMLLSFLFARTRQEERCTFDNNFLIIIGFFTLILNIAVIAQKYSLIKHTYGLQLTIVGIIVATIMIVISATRHGYI